MLALTLRTWEMIVIDTPEGELRITPCPLPRAFQVNLCPNQTLRVEPVAEANLRQDPGAKKWIIVDSAGGQVRLRRTFHRMPRGAADAPSPVRPAAPPSPQPSEGPPPRLINCHLAIDAPRSMRIFRRPLAQAGPPPAQPPQPPGQGTA